MIKRPLIWILCAYLAGLYLAWQGFPVIIAVIIALCSGLIIYLLLYKFRISLISRRDSFLWCLPLFLVFGFCAMRGQLTMPQVYDVFDQKVSCELSGKITMIVKKQWGKALYVNNDVITLPGQDRYICENVIVFCYETSEGGYGQSGSSRPDQSLKENYRTGNRITVRGTLQKFSEPSNPGQFNEKLYYQIENIDFKMTAKQITLTSARYSRFHACLDQIKNRLLIVYQSILPDKESGTLIAMLLGEKYLLDDEIKQLYQINGISHVLAISGLHISLIGMAVFYLLKKLKFPVAAATFTAIFLIYCYGVLTNFSVSTNRAVVMMTLMLLSGLIGKTYDMLSALALSALIILLQNPIQIFSAGFLLSFGAVLGIAVIFPCFMKLFPSKNALASSLFISISAQMTTTPFVIYFFYQFPVYSILTNLIILPFVSLLTLTSIIAGIAGAVWLPFGIFLIGGADYILKFYEWVCRIGSSLPCSLITIGRPDHLRLLVYAILLAVFVWSVRKYEKWYSVIIPAAALLLLILPGRKEGLEITMMDVGQGDAIYMENKSGTTYLVDGGSVDVKKAGINRIQPFLLAQGTDCIDYAIISHSDSDHISGLKEMIEAGKIKVRNLVLPDIKEKDDAYLELEALAEDKNIKLLYIRTGDVIKDGSLRIFCLHPAAGDTVTTNNSYSTVLSITYGEFDMLLTGDIEKDGEEMITDLLKNPEIWAEYYHEQTGEDDSSLKPAADYDILKVAHHGSKYSTLEDFLTLIKPEYSLISCGKGNSYGHPHKELLERLRQAGSEIKITYETGAVMIRTDGKKMEIRNYLEQ